MSNRRVVLLLTCLGGLVWAAPVVQAQLSSQISQAQRAQWDRHTASRQATLDRHEPAPLRKEGFIQQLRALPQASVQALHEAEERQFRLPPRANQVQTNPVRRAQVNMRTPAATSQSISQNTSPQRNYSLPAQPTGRSTLQHTHESPWVERINQRESSQTQTTRVPQSMPPTYSGLQNRPATSYQLVGEQLQYSDRRQAWDEPVDEWESVDLEFADSTQQNFSEATFSEPRVGRIAEERSVVGNVGEKFDEINTDGHVDDDYADRELPQVELEVGEEPRKESFEALTAESLQSAPRVSRVPLPRFAATANASLKSASLPSASLPSASQSTGPLSIGDRIADAPARIVATPVSATPQLGSTRISAATLKSDLSDLQDMANSDSGSSLSLPKLHLPAPVLTGPQFPPLPSTLPSTAITDDEDSADEKSVDFSPTNRQSLSDTIAKDTIAKQTVAKQTEPETAKMPLPSSDPTSLGVTLPSASQLVPTSSAPTSPAPLSNRTPRLVAEETQVNPLPDSPTSPDQRLKMEAPHVAVVLNGPSDLPIGTPAQYEIVVRNQDSIDLQGLILRLDIPRGVKVNALKPTHGQFELETAPDGLTMVTWGFEHLAAGQTASAPMQLVASSAQNFAVAMEWTLMPMAGSSSIDVLTPRLELALDGPAEVRFGQANTYRLHIRNPGTAAANQIAVRLSAEPFGSSAAEIEHIAPGEEEVIEVELTFNERGSINIVALAEEQSGLASKTAIAVIVRQAVVQAQLLATPLVYHGTPTECRVRLKNTGDADALDLRATLQLPEGAGLVSAPPGAVLSGRELAWRIDKLIAGGSEEYTLQLKLTADGSNALALQCSGAGDVSASATAVTRVESITDLKLFVNDPIAPAPVGSEVVYELTLTNRGSKAATNVKVVAQFSDGIEPTRGEGHAVRVVPGQTLFEPLPRLAAGETVNLKVFAKAAASGIHRFRVEVRSDESEVRLIQEESTQYLEPISRMAAPVTGSSTLR